MTYALIIVAKDHPRNPWPQAMHRPLYDMLSDEEVTKLNEGAWLVHLDSSLLFFAGLIEIARKEKLPYQVAFFGEKPLFVSEAKTPA